LNTASLHVIGTTHQARYSEDFDQRLDAVINGAHDSARATLELDELVLLSVLSHFAAAGPYDPSNPAPAWGLEADPNDPRARFHRYVIHYSANLVDVVTFRGIALATDQSIIADAGVSTLGEP
jgi:hypothetical protein